MWRVHQTDPATPEWVPRLNLFYRPDIKRRTAQKAPHPDWAPKDTHDRRLDLNRCTLSEGLNSRISYRKSTTDSPDEPQRMIWKNEFVRWYQIIRCRRKHRVKFIPTDVDRTIVFGLPSTPCSVFCRVTCWNSFIEWPICILFLLCCWTGFPLLTRSVRKSPCFPFCSCWALQLSRICLRTGGDTPAIKRSITALVGFITGKHSTYFRLNYKRETFYIIQPKSRRKYTQNQYKMVYRKKNKNLWQQSRKHVLCPPLCHL